MRIEEVFDSINEVLNEFDFFKFLMRISDYIAYFASFMVVINQLTYLGEFANAVWTYIFIRADLESMIFESNVLSVWFIRYPVEFNDIISPVSNATPTFIRSG